MSTKKILAVITLPLIGVAIFIITLPFLLVARTIDYAEGIAKTVIGEIKKFYN